MRPAVGSSCHDQTETSFVDLPLLSLAPASFAIGTTEYVVMGLLPDVASELAVSIPKAGLLVTSYALSVAFGSPFLVIDCTPQSPPRPAFTDDDLRPWQCGVRAGTN
jgi:hypothetical protein